MFSTCFETVGWSSGRGLYKQVWYNVFYEYMHQVEKCVPYIVFYLQACLRIVMSMIYRNNRSVCACVCMCVCVRARVSFALYVTSPIKMSGNGQYIWHRSGSHVSACRNSSSFSSPFRVFVFISHSSFLLAPFYDTLLLPTSPLPLTWELFICSYLSSWW